MKGVSFIDMKIISITQNYKELNLADFKNTISYNTDKFNIITFNNINENCNIYRSINKRYT